VALMRSRGLPVSTASNLHVGMISGEEFTFTTLYRSLIDRLKTYRSLNAGTSLDI
jgi:hypothetical protein